jgi:hypothetical protein
MNRGTWVLVGTLIVGGILLQIPAHNDMDMEESEDAETPRAAEPGTARVDLEVTGMT